MHAQTTIALADRVDYASWSDIPANGQIVLNLKAKEALFCQGDDADFVYEVLDGVLTAYTLLPDGRRQVAGFHYPGDIIGLEHGRTYHCNCDAIGQARVKSLPRKTLLRIAEGQPKLASKLLEHTTSQLAGMHDHFVLLGRKSAMEKVASFILAVAKRHVADDTCEVRFQLPMTRSDIGDYLGLTIETVSRCITKLKLAGIIELPSPASVRITDIRELDKLAGETGDAVC